MKLQAQSSGALNVALNKALRCVNAKNPISILENVLLVQRNDKFYFVASSGEAQLTLPAPLTVIKGAYEKSMAIPARLITSLLGSLPESTITLDVSEERIHINYVCEGNNQVTDGTFCVPYLDGESFPVMKPVKNIEMGVTLPNRIFHDAIKQSQNFVGNDVLRPVMSSMCLDVAEDGSELIFVASDGNKLIKRTLSNNPAKGGAEFVITGKTEKILVPSAYFSVLTSMDMGDTMTVQTDGNAICFRTGDMECICTVMNGRYPNYNSVIPTGNPYYFVFEKKDILSIIKRVGIFSSEASRLIVLGYENKNVKVSANDIDNSRSAEENLPLLDSQCGSLEIGFNIDHLLSAVRVIPSDQIRMELSGASRAAILKAESPTPTTLSLIMPMVIE